MADAKTTIANLPVAPPTPGFVKPATTGKKILFASWGIAVALAALQDVLIKKDWPCPGRYIRISGLFLLLAILSEVNENFAATLGVGFTLVFFTNEAQKEVVRTGTFFGIKV